MTVHIRLTLCLALGISGCSAVAESRSEGQGSATQELVCADLTTVATIKNLPNSAIGGNIQGESGIQGCGTLIDGATETLKHSGCTNGTGWTVTVYDKNGNQLKQWTNVTVGSTLDFNSP